MTYSPGNAANRFDVFLQTSEGFRWLRSDDRRHSRLDDMRLVSGNLLDCFAEDFHVIKTDAGDNGQLGLNHVCRIEPSAKTHLDKSNIYSMIPECEKREGGYQFEYGAEITRGVPSIRNWTKLRMNSGEVIAGEIIAVDPDALADLDEVRRNSGAGSVSGREQDSLKMG